MGNNEKVNSNKLFCTLKISKGLIEYVQKKIKFFLSQSWQMQALPEGVPDALLFWKYMGIKILLKITTHFQIHFIVG